MRLARAAVFAAFAIAGPAAAKEPLLAQLAPCAADADHAICLLKVAAREDAGDLLWRDPDLRAAPQILAAVGVSGAEVERWRRSEEGQTHQMFFGPIDQAETAVDRAVTLDHAGRTPAEALQPILDLGNRAPELPPFFAGSQVASPRLLALAHLTREPLGPKAAGRPLRQAALHAWEAELAARHGRADEVSEAGALAQGYALIGDEAGVQRALALEPRPDNRIAALLDLQRVADAVPLAQRITGGDLEPSLMTDAQRIRDRQAAAEAGLVRALPDMAATARREGNPDIAQMIEAMARDQARRPTAAPRVRAAEVRAEAANRVVEIRLRVVRKAVLSGHPELARPLADELLAAPRSGFEGEQAGSAASELVRAASPDVALAWLEKQDAALQAALRRNTDSMVLQGQIISLAAGWRALGRQDRIDTLTAHLKPLAQAEIARRASHPNEAVQTPATWQLTRILLADGRHDEAQALGVAGGTELLQDDIQRRRGVGRLADYLARARNENDRISILTNCVSESAAVKAYRDVAACYVAQRAGMTAPRQIYYTAQTSLLYAGQAADADELAVAREILAAALTTAPAALAADPAIANEPESSLDRLAVVAIAKAELRADGRLPKKWP